MQVGRSEFGTRPRPSMVAFNLRFPGQYYDAETGKHYNYFRDYDPATGRYIQSDPIGLRGGINTFGYVGSSPLQWSDFWGLTRGLDPNGQECKALEKKITNIRDQLEKRRTDITFNRNNLPLTPPYPGAPNSASVYGHQKIVDELQETLDRRVKEYAEKCGCGPDEPCGGGGGGGAGSGNNSTATTLMGLGFVGAACVAICVIQPQLCVPALFLGGMAVR